MTVVRPNSIAGINSITVQTGQALNIHDADGNLIRNITSSSGVSTFSSLHVGSGTTTNTQGISVGTGCSIVSGTVNTLELYTNNSERLRIDSSGRLLLGTTTVYAASGTGNMMFSVNKDATSRSDISISNQSSGDNASAAVVLATHGQDFILEATGSGNSTDGVRAFRILSGTSERVGIDSTGQIQLNTDGSQTASNISVGAGADLKIYHDGSDSYIRNITNTDLRIQNIGNAGIDIYTQNSYPIVFTTNGSERASIGIAGTFTPGADNTQNLGSPTKRWANLYTGDLNLCNEGSYNEIDGTSGSWTMQEGDSDLFLINRKSGKQYKFNLTEVN